MADINVLWIGQSQAEQLPLRGSVTAALPGTSYFTYGTDNFPSNPRTHATGAWDTPVKGLARFLNRIKSVSGADNVRAIMACDGGDALHVDAYTGYEDVAPSYWSNFTFVSDPYNGGLAYQHMLDQITASGVTPDAVIWHQGEQDALNGTVDYAKYLSALQSLIARIRTDLNNPALPFLICVTGKRTTGVDAKHWAIEMAQVAGALADDNAHICCFNHHHDIQDTTHYKDSEGVDEFADEAAQGVLGVLGYVTYWLGARVLTARQLTTTKVLVAVQHFGGTSLDRNPAFRLEDDSDVITISTVTALENHHYRLDLARSINGICKLQTDYGANPPSPYCMDNSGLTLPFQQREIIVGGAYGS